MIFKNYKKLIILLSLVFSFALQAKEIEIRTLGKFSVTIRANEEILLNNEEELVISCMCNDAPKALEAYIKNIYAMCDKNKMRVKDVNITANRKYGKNGNYWYTIIKIEKRRCS